MSDFKYELIKVCSRKGRSYYHVYPQESIGFLPADFKTLNVKLSQQKFSVISFADCDVTVFASGRMLIENLEGVEDRAHAIVKQIVDLVRQQK
jgi:hypothetical protein